MIKANELRVGNFLYRSDGSIITVKRLIYNDNDILVNETDGLFTLGYTALPIPLTEEILLKCGFNKDYKKGYIGIDVKSNVTTDFVLTEPLVLGEFQKSYCWEYKAGGLSFFNKLEYLHQLQNLYFALTGHELKIEL